MALRFRRHSLDGLSPPFIPPDLQQQQPAKDSMCDPLLVSSDDESSLQDVVVQRRLPTGKVLLNTVPAPTKIKRISNKPRAKRVLLPPPPPLRPAAAAASSTTSTTGYDSDSSLSSGEPQRAELIPRANGIMHLSPVDKFHKVFVLVNQVMDFESLGTFHIDPRFKLQYLAGGQPIPNGIVVHSTRLHQSWTFSIHYALTADGRSTVLKFRIVHISSGQITERTESAKQAETRSRFTKWRTIANSLFLEAVAKASEYFSQRALQGVEGAEESATQLSTKGSTGRKCTDHIGMFGLRSAEMQAFVLQYLTRLQ